MTAEMLQDIQGQQPITFEVMEANTSEVDGKAVLARVRGPFFFPDGVSRNKRFYPESLWKRVISSQRIAERLQNRHMFGTISHNQSLKEEDILAGKFSHVVTALEISENSGSKQGIGEALILNTPAGRILETLLRAGVKMFVSSRASGAFSGKKGDLDVVDEDSYELETFDFVFDPGFLQAHPSVVEDVREDLNEVFGGSELFSEKKSSDESPDQPISEEGEKMAGETISELTHSLAATQRELTKREQALQEATDENKELQSEVEDLKRQLEEAKNKVLKLEEGSKEADGATEELKQQLKQFDEFGGVEAAVTALKQTESFLDSAEKKCGGDLDKVTEYLEVGSQVEKLGGLDYINSILENAEHVTSELESMGATIPKIRKLIQNSEKMAEAFEKTRNETRAQKLARELGVKDDTVEKLVSRGFTDDEVKQIIKETSESTSLRNRFRSDRPNAPVNEGGDGGEGAVNPFRDTSLRERLQERYFK